MKVSRPDLKTRLGTNPGLSLTIDDDLNESLEFGKYKKLGDTSSVREAF
jgi:hypothetical protein